DIDECTKNTHKCGANAYCNNTKGGYNCTCHPGYYGDAQQCEPVSVLCHFGNFGCGDGGWTPVMKMDGNKQANSLYSLIADGQYRHTSLGLDTWKSLIGSEASLQKICNKEGFNAVSKDSRFSKARIGILGDNIGDCRTCDSRIGFGTGGDHDNNNTCGNEASVLGPDNGEKHIKAMGYILVQ
ncbi:unnamed protein product, partial [Porites lobata]